ncbi:Cytoplasmic GTPase/eEF2-like protein (ribosomal biogenesis) [Zalerion maritima]|uniref:Ribosome assembly protein 1 n=1 Tax=Zalerion maritima TaxID=339359 RepID=A0AAD5RWJ8_9PEZI|nr:Cytoplasmic GTPase/eEF2-like protein (ribosomal biogenesis) [Zalerion maritima]
MPVIDPKKLATLQGRPDDVRNICILAHVDHGKTTLSDFLLATNGIVPASMAGQARFLDNRPDEQERGITMKSSAISLHFGMRKYHEPKEYLINLIDSPGHIDFSSEVSTASRLCDGAIVLVDAVEGVCSQTVTVLRQTWIEKLKPLLVINKMDRLVTELQLSPTEAYTHLTKIVEQVNAVLGSFFQGERMEEDLNWREKMEARVAAAAAKEAEATAAAGTEKGDSVDFEFLERDDEDIYFAPEKENVIFCSAIDGWAFTPRQFASMYEKKLGMKRSVLEKVLWGNFYLDPKTKKVIGPKHLRGRPLKPIFVQLVLEQIWAVYQATTGIGTETRDPVRLEKITQSLNINLQPSVVRSSDPRKKLTAVFASWLPLSTALLVSVVENIPSPKVAQPERLPPLLDGTPGASHIDPKVRSAMLDLESAKEDPVVAYVSKMVSIPQKNLPENRRMPGRADRDAVIERTKQLRQERAQAVEGPQQGSISTLSQSLTNTPLDNAKAEREKEEQVELEVLIGFARIYSGTISVGDEIYVLSPRYSPARPHEKPEPQKVKITALYMLMGGELEILGSVPAGVVFGIGGLEGYILKSGTLCSQLEGAVNLASANMGGKPIYRVSLTPRTPLDLDKMVRGIKLLVQSDPCAEYAHMKTGEHVLSTAGELHLERCLLDLKERFARCDIQASEPMVPYRETIVQAAEMKPPANKELGRGAVVVATGSGLVTVKLRVRPLANDVTEFLVKNPGSVRGLLGEKQAKDTASEKIEGDDESEGVLSPEELKKELQNRLEKSKNRDVWKNVANNIVAFGPRRTGPNLLIDITPDRIFPRAFSQIPAIVSNGPDGDLKPTDFTDRIAYAFHLMMESGPLCNEPVRGVAVFIEEVSVKQPEGEAQVDHGRLTSEVLKSVQQSIKNGFLDWSPRMMLATYSVEIQASTEVIGRVYDVLTRRRGKIISEEMKEGTPFFSIQARLPVAESFGFSTEMRKRTSGAAQPQLIFAGFDILDEDPFWVPFTEDDLEDLGELADKENVAKRYMDKVRKRKGLLVEGRNVKRDAEKQKTLKR